MSFKKLIEQLIAYSEGEIVGKIVIVCFRLYKLYHSPDPRKTHRLDMQIILL